MNKLMRAEFYQLKHHYRNYFYAALALLGPVLLVLGFKYLDTHAVANVTMTGVEMMDPIEVLSISFNQIAESFSFIYILLIADSVFNNELAHRTLNNQVGYGYSRLQIFASKQLTSVIILLISLGSAVASFLICMKIAYQADVLALLQTIFHHQLLIMMPVYLALSALVIGFTFYTNQTSVMIAIFAIFFIAIPTIIKIGGAFYPWMAACVPYLFTELGMNTPIQWFGMNAAPFLGLIYLAVFLWGGYAIFRRRELK